MKIRKEKFNIYKYGNEAFAIRLILKGGFRYAQGIHLTRNNRRTFSFIHSFRDLHIPYHVLWIKKYMNRYVDESHVELISKDKVIEFDGT